MTVSTSLDRCVFINCPFDPLFARLLRPLVFCIMDVGLEPRLAPERLNSAESRLEKLSLRELTDGMRQWIAENPSPGIEERDRL